MAAPTLSRVVQVRFSDADYDQLRALAEEHNVALSRVIRLLASWALLHPQRDDDQELDEQRPLTPSELVALLVEDDRAS